MELKVYIEQMKEGKTVLIQGTVPSNSFLPEEPDLAFSKEVELKGEAYLAGDHLILHLKAHTVAYIPCSICNRSVEAPIDLPNFYHAEPLEEIPSGVFDFSEVLRCDLLLALPRFVECQGNCPERENIKNYLKHPSHTQFPFSDL